MAEVQPPANFTELIAGAGRLYKRNTRALILLFLVLAVAGALFQYVSIVSADRLGESDSLALTFGYVIPVIANVIVGSIGLGLAAHRIFEPHDPEVAETAGPSAGAVERAPGSFPWKEAVASGLLASVISLIVTTMFGGLSFLFVSLLYGPAIVIHVVVLEGFRLGDAVTRARMLLRGHMLRILGYLFAIAFGLGLLQFTAIQIVGTSTETISDIVQGILLILTILVLQALLLPYYAAASYLTYTDLRHREVED